MSMWMLTEEKKNELLRQVDKKMTELEIMKNKTKADLWREDIDVFMEKLDEIEEKERKDAKDVVVKPGKKEVSSNKIALVL